MRRRILFIIVGGIIVIVGIVIAAYIYIFQPEPQPEVTDQPATDQPVEDAPAEEQVSALPQPVPDQTFEVLGIDIVEENELDDAVTIERNASVFAEKYGSHSNQSSFQGIRDLVDLATEDLEPWIYKYIEQLQDRYPSPDVYVGVNTQVLSVQFIVLERDSAIVIVKTQREQFEGNTDKPSISRQDLRLEFKKVGSNWLVDAAYWQ